MLSSRKKHKNPPGFTLLELLVVIAIMIFIATVATVNYMGAARAAGYTAGQTAILGNLQLAHQRACLDAAPVYFCILNPTNYIIVRAGGTITDPQYPDGDLSPTPAAGQGFVLYDLYSDLSGLSSSGSVFNMTRSLSPGGTRIPPYLFWQVESKPHYGNSAYAMHVLPAPGPGSTLMSQSTDWQSGDQYGFPLHAVQQTPQGFYLSVKTAPPALDHFNIKFMPDGTASSEAPTTDNQGHACACVFYLTEKLREGAGDAGHYTFDVSLGGKIMSE